MDVGWWLMVTYLLIGWRHYDVMWDFPRGFPNVIKLLPVLNAHKGFYLFDQTEWRRIKRQNRECWVMRLVCLNCLDFETQDEYAYSMRPPRPGPRQRVEISHHWHLHCVSKNAPNSASCIHVVLTRSSPLGTCCFRNLAHSMSSLMVFLNICCFITAEVHLCCLHYFGAF